LSQPRALQVVKKVSRSRWAASCASNRSRLLSLVARRISDRRVLKLIRQWLNAAVVEQGQWQPTEVGSPQGGVFSPLLANIYLHVLDMYRVTRYAGLGELARYADDGAPRRREGGFMN
jgi:retron-type reverse transcriptase